MKPATDRYDPVRASPILNAPTPPFEFCTVAEFSFTSTLSRDSALVPGSVSTVPGSASVATDKTDAATYGVIAVSPHSPGAAVQTALASSVAPRNIAMNPSALTQSPIAGGSPL